MHIRVGQNVINSVKNFEGLENISIEKFYSRRHKTEFRSSVFKIRGTFPSFNSHPQIGPPGLAVCVIEYGCSLCSHPQLGPSSFAIGKAPKNFVKWRLCAFE